MEPTPAPVANERPLLLLSNDDGVHAEGLRLFARAVASLGDVVIVAPASEQSTRSHALTLHRPLRVLPLGDGVWSVDGTPADCTYVALHHPTMLPRRPTLVLSGINHGANLGSDVFYSGTVAAAREAAFRGVAAMALSMPSSADPAVCAALAVPFVARLLRALEATPPGVTPLLNLNFPHGEPKGARNTRLGVRTYEDIVEVREDPRGRQYLWIGGPSVVHPLVEGSDTEAFDAGFISLSALRLDLDTDGFAPLVDAVAG
jgi:5'-nucleotidase